MAIVAPLSRYRRNSHLIWLAVFLGLATWFFYDGNYNQKFIDKHTVGGKPDDTLVINRTAPPYIMVGAFLVVANFFRIRNDRVRIDDTMLTIHYLAIPLKEVVQVDRTHFDDKGFFVLSYKSGGIEKQIKLYSRKYDNLAAVLDRLIEEISGSVQKEGKTQS